MYTYTYYSPSLYPSLPHKIILGQKLLADKTENIKSCKTCVAIDEMFESYPFHKML